MERFLAYVALLDPEFARRIRGASPEQIAELEQFAGRPLPHSYRDFLARMGTNDGDLNLTVDGTTKITEVLDYYRSEVRTGARELPRKCILIGVGAISIPDIALNCQGSGEPSVVFTDGDEMAGLYAETLDKLLHNTAFRKYRLALYPWEAFFAASYASIGKRDLSGAARAIALECGLQPAWFSDRVTCCAEKSDAAACMSQYEGQGIAIRVAAQDRLEVSRIGSAMVHQLGVRLVEWTDRSGAA